MMASSRCLHGASVIEVVVVVVVVNFVVVERVVCRQTIPAHDRAEPGCW